MVNRSEVGMLEEKAMQIEEKEKNLFDKTTFAWLTVGLLIGHLPPLLRAESFLQAPF